MLNTCHPGLRHVVHMTCLDAYTPMPQHFEPTMRTLLSFSDALCSQLLLWWVQQQPDLPSWAVPHPYCCPCCHHSFSCSCI